LQAHGAIDEPTAVLVTELAKLQARTVGGTEDYIVTREFAALATDQQKLDVLRACFAVGAASGTISAEESAAVNQIAKELALDPELVNEIRSEFHDRLSAVQEVRRLAGGR
jgi:tellurite resistance protein